LFGFAAVRKNKNLTLLCEAVEKRENVPANIWKDFPSNIHSLLKEEQIMKHSANIVKLTLVLVMEEYLILNVTS
jgi:hypothetical protein